MARPFWQRKTLEQMTAGEWDSLCDGCGKCCLHKFEDEDSGEIAYTNVACRYLDRESCRCTAYQQRTELVSDCLVLQPTQRSTFEWLPSTCAYRLLAQGDALPDWHPLISGDNESVHYAGASVRYGAISEDNVHPDALEEHIVQWV